MNTSRLTGALDELVRKYREIDFSHWEIQCPCGEHHFNDYAHCDPNDDSWWQADTDALEIVNDADGRRWANVSITLYPKGVHTMPPALSVGLAVYEDGTVEGVWSNGESFTYIQVNSHAV